MTLTRRLTLFFLAALAVVMVSFSTTLYLLAEHHLTRQFDDRLEAAARNLGSAADAERDGVEWEPASRPLALAPGVFGDRLHWMVTTEDGQVIDHSLQPGAEELLASATRLKWSGHRKCRSLEYREQDWRVTRLQLVPDPPASPERVARGKHPVLILTVAVPLDPVLVTLRTLAAALVALTLVGLGIAALAGRAVCRRALAPVARMADAARSMGVTDLTHRLPAPATRDELADLGRAFNDLLDRLAEAFDRERRFAGEASHQLRTPLAAVIGQLEVALRRERAPEEYRETLETVLAQAGRLRRVVEALLFLARSESEAALPGLERTDLTAWVRDRLQGLREHARGGDLRFEPSGKEPVWARIHPDLFGELFDALLDNALKYSAGGTPVIVRTGSDEKGGWVEVADRGCGIAPADLPHLFRPFFRSDAARRLGAAGAGLGLAVAGRIAAAHGGSITVESEPGRGSRFRIQLPTPSDAGNTS